MQQAGLPTVGTQLAQVTGGECAITQQICLVDLSGITSEWLRAAAGANREHLRAQSPTFRRS